MRKLASLLLIILACAWLPAAEPWLQVETEHFTFIFREDQRAAVEELVTYADQVHQQVTAYIGTDVPPADVVIYGETDFANGYYNPNPPQHIALYAVQPSLPWIGAGAESWLRLLFVHEFTHYAQANHRPGFFHALGMIFGSSINGIDIGFVPRWLTEGLAIHTESTMTGGGRLNDPLFELRYKALIVEDDLFSLWQAGYASHLAPAGRPYVAGAFIIEALVEEYGEEFVRDFMSRYSSFPLFGMWGAVRGATGHRMLDLYEEIEGELEVRYRDATARPVDPRISPDVAGDYYLPTQTERGLITLRRRPDRRTAFVLLDPATRSETVLFTVPVSDSRSWSVTTDGNLIAFASTAARPFPDESDTNSNLYVRNLISGSTRTLSSGGGFYQPSISAGGDYLVAVERDGLYQRLVYFLLENGDAGARPLFEPPQSRFYYPAVSPDGRRVTVAHNQNGSQQLIVLSGPNANEPGRVLKTLPRVDGADPFGARFDGNEAITFAAHVDGELSLFRYELETEQMQRIATDRVGVISGYTTSDSVIYEAYTSDGHVVRRGGSTPVSVVPDRLMPAPAPSITPRHPAVEPQPYHSFPLPQFWLPWIVARSIQGSGDFIGVGATVVGADLLGRSSWQTEVVYFPQLQRAGYGANVQWARGRFSGALSATEQYLGLVDAGSEWIYVQRFQHSVALQSALFAQYELGVSQTLVLSAELQHLFDYGSPERFGLPGILTGEASFLGAQFVPSVSLMYTGTPFAARNAAASPGGRGISAGAALPLTSPGYQYDGLVTGANAYVNVPLGASHVIQTAVSARFPTNPVYRASYDLIGFQNETESARPDLRGTHKVTVEYLPPYLLVDIPLLSSVGITGLGVNGFMETTGSFDFRPAGFALDPQIAIGLGATAVLTYSTIDFPINAGVVARIDTQNLGISWGWYTEIDLLESIGTVGDYLSM